MTRIMVYLRQPEYYDVSLRLAIAVAIFVTAIGAGIGALIGHYLAYLTFNGL